MQERNKCLIFLFLIVFEYLKDLKIMTEIKFRENTSA